MMRLIYISTILFWVSSCSKEDIQPQGFEEVNFITDPNSAQTFEYFYDDGDLVGFGLTDYVLKINTEAGTFNSEENLLIRYKEEINQLSDSIIPFTYFMGLKYNGELTKALDVSYNLDYQYNNSAHQSYDEFVFFREHINQMRLFKINYEGLASVYYDPDIIVEEIPFELSDDAIHFSTMDKDALFGLCWVEKNWSDTINISYTGNVQTHVYQGNRAKQAVPESGAVSGDDLFISYSANSLTSSTNSSTSWRLESINLIVHNPSLGVIENSDLICDLIVYKEVNSVDVYTNLTVNPSTIVEITTWPELFEKGTLTFSGQILNEFQQTNSTINMSIEFTRQR